MPGSTFGTPMQAPGSSWGQRPRGMSDMQIRRGQDAGQQHFEREAANESTRNSLYAQKYALGQSLSMQANPANPRSVTDTSMTIKSPGSVPGGQGGSQGGGSNGDGGGSGAPQGGQLPPNIDGHYMPLINMGFTPSAVSAPHAALGAASYSPADAQAFQDAEFGKAKATAGSLGRSAVEGLRGEMSGRGIGGSGSEMRGVSDRLAAATNPLADLNVAHLGQDYAHAQNERNIAESRVSQQFQGDLTQRGQDLSTQQAMNALKAMLAQTKYQGDITQRNFDISALLKGLQY